MKENGWKWAVAIITGILGTSIYGITKCSDQKARTSII